MQKCWRLVVTGNGSKEKRGTGRGRISPPIVIELERVLEYFLRGSAATALNDVGRKATAYCSIGFQPVSGRKCVTRESLSATQPAPSRRPIRRAVACSGHRHLPVGQTTRWKPMLCYTALRRVERYPKVILTALPRTHREDATV
jgi:hypothetical protein